MVCVLLQVLEDAHIYVLEVVSSITDSGGAVRFWADDQDPPRRCFVDECVEEILALARRDEPAAKLQIHGGYVFAGLSPNLTLTLTLTLTLILILPLFPLTVILTLIVGLLSTVNNYMRHFHEHRKVIYMADQLAAESMKRIAEAVSVLWQSKVMQEILGIDSSLQPAQLLQFCTDFIVQVSYVSKNRSAPCVSIF